MLDITQGERVASGSREPESATVRRAEEFLRRRAPVILLVLAIVLCVTEAAIRIVPPRFTARAEVLLNSRSERTFGHDDTAHLVSLDPADVESALVLLKGGSLLGRVVRNEHLAEDPAFSAPPAVPLWRRPLALVLGAPPPPSASPELRAVAHLARILRVERVGKSYALSIAITAGEPDLAARLANAVAGALVHDQRDAHLEASRRAAAFFAERLGPLGDRLRQSEENLERFRRDNNLIAKTVSGQPAGTAATINEQQLAELNSRLALARGETAQAWGRYDQARSLQARGGLLDSVPDVVRSTLIGQLREQQAVVARKEADLAARYTDAYPLLVNARAEKREIDRAIAREIARILANLKGAYEIARSQEDAIHADVALATGAAGLDTDLGSRLRDFERLKVVDQTLFETYLAKAKAAEQQAGFETDDVRIISPAVPPTVPAFPQASLVLGCMTVFGLGLGTALGLLLDARARGFLTPQHTEAALGIPVLASVPWLTARERLVEGRLMDPHSFLASRPHSRFADAVHAIRAGVRLSEGSPPQVLLVTSATEGEGKSVIALSLAVSAARAGQRVLVLDADLRSPSLSRCFGLQDRLGLVDMLAGLVGTEETTVSVGAGLKVMPSGRRSAVAPDLFASARMARYIDHLRGLYDLVVIDVAPADAVVDARILAQLSDRIVFVVGWRRTARDLVARHLRALSQHQRVAGIVLNKFENSPLPRFGALFPRSRPARRQEFETG